MLYHLSQIFKNVHPLFNVVHYVSFRTMAALLTALICSFLFGRVFLGLSQKFFRSKAREWTPEAHKAKDNMPTMGGLLILSVVIVNSLLWCNLSKPFIWIFLGCLIGFGVLGFWDDWCKIKKSKGISARSKFLLQLTIAFFTVFFLLFAGLSTTISFPFFKWLNPNLGWLYIPWAMFIIVGCSNAVNLTDGLDGLAITSLIPNFATFTFICYLAGNYKIAQYLHIPFAGSAEVAIVGATLVGASIGFLWYNAYPAQIFMGDIGSLA